MKALSKLYLANLTEFLSNRRALFLTIAFPVLFIVIFGAVFTNQDKVDATVGIVLEDAADPVSAEIFKALESAPKADANSDGALDDKDREKNPFSELKFKAGTKAALVAELRQGKLDAIITIPAGLAKRAAAGKERAVRDAAAQLELQREHTAQPPASSAGEPGASPTDQARAHAAARAEIYPLVPATQMVLAAPTSSAATLALSAAAKPGWKDAHFISEIRPRAKPSPTPSLRLAATPPPSPGFALSSASAPMLASEPMPDADLYPSALLRRTEIVADDPKPLPPARITLTIDPARQLLRPVLQGLVAHIVEGIDARISGQSPFAELQTENILARELRTIDYLLPGILALSIMQLGLFATAPPLVALRVQGVLKRLSATPLPRTTLLTAYIAFRLTIALFQTMLTVLIGRYAFKVAMVGSWWQFSGWVLLGTMAFLSVGFFVAAVSKNEESCIAIGNVINLPMILLSGVFFPVNHLSRVWDYIIMLVPLNYLADALRTTMVDAPPLHSAGINALVLGGWIVVMTTLAIRFFSWESR